MSVFRFFIAAMLLTAPVAAPAATTTIFTEDFAEEVAGATGTVATLNFAGLDQFDIVDGAVDLFTNGGFGLPCGSAGCLDLDGTVGNAARLESKSALSFASGASYDFTLDISGKNGNGNESLTFGVIGGPSQVLSMPVNDNAARTVTLSFIGAGSVAKIFIDHAGGDNFGILLDAVTITETTGAAVIPLPAALPLMLAGLGGLAYVGRRRA